MPFEVSRSPLEYLRLLAREQVTVLCQTPSAFYQLMAADTNSPQLSGQLALRSVVFGGEALDPKRLQEWYTHHPQDTPVLTNMYGITETTVHVSHTTLDTNRVAHPHGASLIGQPIPDLGTFVLDQRLQPVPPGVTGELYVAGAGLARGYRGAQA